MIIVSDIDATLADIGERLKRAGKQPAVKHKRKFQKWLDKLQNSKILLDDSAIPCMRELLVCLTKRCKIIYLTGRSCIYRRVTKKWLKLHGFPPGPLFMRPKNSYTTAREFKERLMLKIAKQAGGEKILCIDDDGDGTCAIAYKKHGWTHLKVMENI